MSNIITKELIENAFSYDTYKEIVRKLILKNKTSGNNQSESNIYFTKLNAERVKRIEKTTVLNEELKRQLDKINSPLIVLVIAEAWCGDVAQNLPPLKVISDFNPNVDVKIIFRDENPEVMDQFLTKGTRSIPVFLLIKKDSLEVIGKWGPRPEPAQEIMREAKSRKDYSHDEATKEIQLWYAKDRTLTFQKELSDFLNIISSD
ncbi:MAG TPA: thioredoxin family protein [Ignavibacteria bacterium]|nr:thioredoxin family protein [Ignavibacteria bacterium]HQY51013.1 thioredoxin family protein [Ignavibacteria bacterium]HRA99437.1 thioredoxin family protein [Ignavibacteria bacterium]